MTGNGADIIVIGAGIAGASVAWHVKNRARVILLEQESTPGYHTTGRSAAFYSETYGGPEIQPLSSASKHFLFNPPADFFEGALVKPRGALYMARQDQVPLLQAQYQRFKMATPALRFLSSPEMQQFAPMMHPDWCAAALYDPDCKDMDVAALHAGYLRKADVRTGAMVQHIESTASGWKLITVAGTFFAKTLVNAAGAWGDDIARLAGVAALGLEPRRRTIITFQSEMPVNSAAPLILDAAEEFYFKPDGTDIWASPGDETLDLPGDVQPGELDVAITIDRIERATRYKIKTIKRKWAGLRTFAPDRLPVYGFDPATPDFFWCTGQGGWGIQTAPAAGALCAALLLGDRLPQKLQNWGITPQRYARRPA